MEQEENVCEWADGTWCFVTDLWEMSHMSDDYKITYFDEEKHL